MLLSIIITILLGALVGWVASIITKRDAEHGAVENILVGVAGAFIGSLIANGFNATDGWISLTIGDVFWAFVGSVLLLVILNLMQRGRVR